MGVDRERAVDGSNLVLEVDDDSFSNLEYLFMFQMKGNEPMKMNELGLFATEREIEMEIDR